MKIKRQPSPLENLHNLGRPCYKVLIYLLAIAGYLLLCLLPVRAESDESLSPYLVSTDSLGSSTITHLETNIDAAIANGVLEATITQSYENQGQSSLECHCVLPLPEDVALDSLVVKINGTVIPNLVYGNKLILELAPQETVELVVSFIQPFTAPTDLSELI